MNKYVILVAGGKGSRMKSSVPKQFLRIHGKPLLMHTFQAFQATGENFRYILVLPGKEMETWKKLCEECSFDIPHQIAEGGPTRFHSVKSGLKKIAEDEALVAVHDAVRPLLEPEMIRKVFEMAQYHGAAIPTMPVMESLRERTGSVSKAVNREKYVLVQTPQCFWLSKLKKAYLQSYREDFTDDASVIEADGETLHLVPGSPKNIKITTPEDLKIAAALLVP